SRPNPFQRFKHQTGTLLHPTDGSFAFAFTDWNGDGSQDLIAIKKRGTGTGSIEVHIFSGATNFQNLLLTTGTPLPETADDDTYAFALVDWNRDGRPDLFAVQKKKTDSGTTEINIFSGASNFQEGLLRKVATRLPETDENTDFVVADWSGDGKPDLVAIHKRFTDTRLTEVQILAGKSNFEDEILRVGTRLRETDANWAFAATKWQGGSSLDLVCINRAGQSSTEVGILSGKSLFQEFLVSGSTALQRTDATFDFVVADWDGKGRPELVAVKKSGTGTRSTEVHVLGE
ncbi:VCBS repeat-containing protein, partial [Podospora aff. communis PSN243]